MFRPYSYRKKHTTITSLDPKSLGSKKGSDKNTNAGVKVSLNIDRSLRLTAAVVCSVAGLFVLSHNVLIPVVISYANDEVREPIINPIVDNDLSSEAPAQDADPQFDFEELEYKASQHTEETLRKPRDEELPAFMYITIPKLDIVEAKIQIDSDNMDPREYLGHFKGTCLPGDGCNSFIYGHSTFKYFGNGYEDGDYTSIFSHLEELSYGDEFSIRIDDKVYNYLVDFSRVQSPEEVDPLGNPYPKSIGKHMSTVELFTCTPPGTTKYRLSVVGKLVK